MVKVIAQEVIEVESRRVASEICAIREDFQ